MTEGSLVFFVDNDEEDEDEDEDEEGEIDDEDDEGIMEGLQIDTEFNGDNIEDSIGFFHDDFSALGADNDEQSEETFLHRSQALLR